MCGVCLYTFLASQFSQHRKATHLDSVYAKMFRPPNRIVVVVASSPPHIVEVKVDNPKVVLHCYYRDCSYAREQRSIKSPATDERVRVQNFSIYNCIGVCMHEFVYTPR